ncbi:MAG: ABC transporter substrate-binding protein [Desulfobacterales bacterium]|nr:ABC transporter substrate-binding protein [Desulfobacterales bacterium]
MKRFAASILCTFLAIIMFAGPSWAGARGELKIARWDDINTFDPGWMTSGDRELTIMKCLYNGLVKYKEGSWEIVPDLAESWDTAEDGKSVTFHLRKGVKFHKGYGEMTAEDVKFSFERIIDPESSSSEKGNWGQLDRVEIIDTYTVKLVFKDRMVQLFTSTLPSNSGMIVSKNAATELGREKFSFNPVGTGPYELDKWEPKKHVKLKAFKEYWGKQPAISNVTFVPIVEDATCEMALRTKEIDIGRVALINAGVYKNSRDLNLEVKPSLKHWWIGFTVNKPPFDNADLRMACRYAIDVEKILKAAFFDIAPRANTILPPGLLGHWEDAPAYKVDLKKAKEYLKKGGKPNGFKANLYIWPDEQVKVTAEVIKADLAQIGVDVDIQIKETGAFNKATTTGEPNMYLSYYNTTIDPSYAFSWFFSGEEWNLSKWSNATYDDLCSKGMTESDPNKRAALYVDAQKEIDKDGWAIWLTHGVRVTASQKDVDLGPLYPDGRLAPWTMSFK